jgi:uncharacterized protein YcsI (UPF0317 family)
VQPSHGGMCCRRESIIVRREDLKGLHPREIRSLAREGRWREHTQGIAEGYLQANLVVLPKDLALDFLIFCQRNPQPCPVLEVTDVGDSSLKYMADGADLRTDLPMYRVWKKGQCVAEVDNVLGYWSDQLVSFLLGCSGSFDSALLKAGVRQRHIEEGRLPPAYISNLQCEPAGIFHGPMAVTMRATLKQQVARAFQVTSRYPAAHGAPVHVGDPRQIGIKSLDDIWSDCVACRVGGTTAFTLVEPDEVPVFWACGATPQLVALQAQPEFMITHLPSHMFITDVPLEEMAIL